jgi:hypothetical protein
MPPRAKIGSCGLFSIYHRHRCCKELLIVLDNNVELRTKDFPVTTENEFLGEVNVSY